MRKPHKSYEPLDCDNVMIQAKLEAHRLRKEAISKFWSDVFLLIGSAAHSLARYLNRIKIHCHIRSRDARKA
jgi:hypothetical protein